MPKKTKKLLIATGIFPPSIGGPATYSKLLEDELPRYDITPIVVTFDRVRRWPRGIRHILYFFMLWRASGDADLIYAQDPVSVGYPTSLVARLRGKMFYLRVPGDYAWEQACQRFGVTDVLDVFLAKKDYPKGVKRLRGIQVKVAKRAERIIVPSEYLKSVVVRWGVAPEKIVVIANAIEGELPQEGKEILRSQLALKRKTIISAGRLVPWKGFASLIDGLGGYLKDKEIDLLIAGSGPDEMMLKDIVAKNGLEDRITFLGALTRRDLLRYLKAADVFVLNTAYEGFSHQILEAMSLGTPVVTTRVGGNPELIDDGVHGFLVALNDMDAFRDRIDKIISDQGQSDIISIKARERASLFTKNSALLKLVTTLS